MAVILSEAFYSGVEGPAFRVFPCMREKRVILSEAYFSGVEGPAFAFDFSLLEREQSLRAS
jgi:hypothetical protein